MLGEVIGHVWTLILRFNQKSVIKCSSLFSLNQENIKPLFPPKILACSEAGNHSFPAEA